MARPERGFALSGGKGRTRLTSRRRGMKYIYLAAPGVIALAAPLYNRVDPTVWGIPFFYWFQLVLVPVSAVGIYLYDRAGRA